MDHDISFNLIPDVRTKDSTGQSVPSSDAKPTECIGFQRSVYQNEFYQADQAGIRPQGVIKMNLADYSGEKYLSINGNKYSIYRTFEPGADWIELYYGERVGNG